MLNRHPTSRLLWRRPSYPLRRGRRSLFFVWDRDVENVLVFKNGLLMLCLLGLDAWQRRVDFPPLRATYASRWADRHTLQ